MSEYLGVPPMTLRLFLVSVIDKTCQANPYVELDQVLLLSLPSHALLPSQISAVSLTASYKLTCNNNST